MHRPPGQRLQRRGFYDIGTATHNGESGNTRHTADTIGGGTFISGAIAGTAGNANEKCSDNCVGAPGYCSDIVCPGA